MPRFATIVHWDPTAALRGVSPVKSVREENTANNVEASIVKSVLPAVLVIPLVLQNASYAQVAPSAAQVLVLFARSAQRADTLILLAALYAVNAPLATSANLLAA